MTDRNFVTALARGLDILRCFDRPGAELGVSDIARRTGLNQPTAWRLCHTLVECGYLVRAADGTALRIGAPALTLGYAALHSLPFPAIALPYMRQITGAAKVSTTLSVRQSLEMISVERCDGVFVLPDQPVGWRVPLTAVPSGLAVLAELPDADRRHALAELQAQDPSRWPRRAARVERAISDHARDGYVVHDTMLDGQYAAVAVAMFASSPAADRPAWALSCGGPASSWPADRLSGLGRELLRVKALLEPALRLSA